MAFFDLNIPYTESPNQTSTNNKSTRLKLAVKAMELGYTGVAYNRTITGVMSKDDHCSIFLFPLSSVLKLSPSISSAVNLHRRLLNVPTTAPFRQYTRLTFVVDSEAKGSCLNSGNPVIKSYDIVAVRPLSQDVFDKACKSYEVDIIAIDFSANRFQLRQPLIKAAIERGVYFEITYSGLLVDAPLRRQIISNAKLLVDWTRGKNVIFSSAAASVTEFRGPYDVANLACLLGFSMERAKASLSKTCRSLLENSLRKKKFYKEAIRVELISSTEDDSMDDWLKWDPISSDEGDLQLDDIAKSFAASNKEPKTVKAIDFVSVINELPSHGLQIHDMVTETKSDSKFHDPRKKDDLLKSGNCDVSPVNGNLETLAGVETSETCAMIIEEPEQQNLSLKVYDDTHEENVIDEKEGENMCSDDPNSGILIPIDDNPSNLQCEEANNLSLNACLVPPMTESNEAGLPEEVLEQHMIDTKDVAVIPVSSCLASSGVSLNEDLPEEQMSDAKDVAVTPVSSCLAISGVSLGQDILEEHMSVIGENVSTAPISELATLRPLDEMQINGCDSVVHEPLDDLPMEVNVEVKDDSHMNHFSAQESSSGRVRRKHGGSGRSMSFPFRRWLKPSHSKKTLKERRNSTIRKL
ncbi:putative ribonuclease P [Helianthus annuus]|uniref:Putative RNase P subunit p30 n=1 Tax=Helianthus annuus TaxID=4232 RepID=A0A251SDM0_HELAN|nr:protein GAMETOPHYTE DEFECTIVE 1 isoform X1 [Helianthus annuus]KAF5821479.1 putative ribonuclease P [Helianthus annuus]KAJ0622102.1 putative ribonuclease P [Helianthus annuus]KAJ0947409.1 putative ribonuclease P [Helianthus annuus]